MSGEVKRLWIAVATLGVLLVGTAGVLAWVLVDSRWWFNDAYAEKGPIGDEGPIGPAGPRGPAGPVGPSARDEIEAIQTELDTVRSEFEDFQGSGYSSTTLGDIESRLNDLESNLLTLCQDTEDSFEDTDLFRYISMGCLTY